MHHSQSKAIKPTPPTQAIIGPSNHFFGNLAGKSLKFASIHAKLGFTVTKVIQIINQIFLFGVTHINAKINWYLIA